LMKQIRRLKMSYSHNKGLHGGRVRAVVVSLLYEWFSPNEGISNYGIWNLGMLFQFKSGTSKKEIDNYVNAAVERTIPQYYKNTAIRQIVVYRDFRFITKPVAAFDRAKALIDKITRNKKVYEQLTAVSEAEAIKIWNKFVIYRIKRGNKVKVL